MHVSFIGSPISGKTTTAAKVFARLKEGGINAEFITEFARHYIAEKRLRYEGQLHLDDNDQYSIMFGQMNLDQTMNRASHPETVVVSDSSALNALLYMSDDYRSKDEHVQQLCQMAEKLPGLVFYSAPVGGFQSETTDLNRLHSQKQSLEIDAQIPEIVSRFAPGVQLIRLQGSSEIRAATVLNEIYRYMQSRG